MGKEWTDEEVQAEIRAAVDIVKEDRFLKALSSKLDTKPPDGPPAPPRKDPPEKPDDKPPAAKGSLWWGPQQ
jgi:hypothetical protein